MQDDTKCKLADLENLPPVQPKIIKATNAEFRVVAAAMAVVRKMELDNHIQCSIEGRRFRKMEGHS